MMLLWCRKMRVIQVPIGQFYGSLTIHDSHYLKETKPKEFEGKIWGGKEKMEWFQEL